MTELEYVALALMRSWFPTAYADKEWLASDDGYSWAEISMQDAETAIHALNEWREINEIK